MNGTHVGGNEKPGKPRAVIERSDLNRGKLRVQGTRQTTEAVTARKTLYRESFDA
jgi:hypothetical protein